MIYDFDREVPRCGTLSLKWEFTPAREGAPAPLPTDECSGEDRVLPMWVADMDFPCPEPVVSALVARARHGIYGYAAAPPSYYAAVVNWMARRQGWEIAPEWIVTTPGVVSALHLLVRAFTAPGDGVLIQPPVYHPFYRAIKENGATVVSNPLIYADGRYRMDLADLEAKARDPRVVMAILCSPHNPVGRVWTRDELAAFGEICLRHNVLVVADEIHGDLMLGGRRFTPFASLGAEFAQHAVVCTAPSKTFNLAGLQTSNIIVPAGDLRARFRAAVRSVGLEGVGVFGLVALEAAYNHGEEWLEQVLRYIEGNVAALEHYIEHYIPRIRLVRPEGTYLAWLDCRGLGLDRAGLRRLFLERARVRLDDGYIFGQEGEGFQRMNIACPRSILTEALERIRQAIG